MTQIEDFLSIGQAFFQMAWPLALAFGAVAGAVKAYDRLNGATK